MPRDLVVNGELIKTVIEEDKATAKNVEGGGSEYQNDNTAFRVGPRKGKRESVILGELIKRKKEEKLILPS